MLSLANLAKCINKPFEPLRGIFSSGRKESYVQMYPDAVYKPSNPDQVGPISKDKIELLSREQKLNYVKDIDISLAAHKNRLIRQGLEAEDDDAKSIASNESTETVKPILKDPINSNENEENNSNSPDSSDSSDNSDNENAE